MTSGDLTVLGHLTMTGGTVMTDGAGRLLLPAALPPTLRASPPSSAAGSIFGNGTRTFTIADGTAPIDWT